MKRLIIVLMLIAALSGCVTTYPPPEPTETDPVQTTTEPISTTPSIQPETQPLTEAIGGSGIEYFNWLFSIPNESYAYHPENYFNTAMCCTFSCPEEVPLFWLFYNGFPLDGDVTDEEQAYVSDFLHAKRLKPDNMNDVLNQYFGITLEDINWDKQKLTYWEQTGCYYVAGNDMLMNMYFHIYDFEASEDGIIKIYYYNDCFREDYVMTLQSRITENKYGYRIISNLPCE